MVRILQTLYSILAKAVFRMLDVKSKIASQGRPRVFIHIGTALVLLMTSGCAHDRSRGQSAHGMENPPPVRPMVGREATAIPRVKDDTSPKGERAIAPYHWIKPQPPRCMITDASVPGTAATSPAQPSNVNSKSLEVLVLGLERDCYKKAETDVRFRLLRLQKAIPRDLR